MFMDAWCIDVNNPQFFGILYMAGSQFIVTFPQLVDQSYPRFLDW